MHAADDITLDPSFEILCCTHTVPRSKLRIITCSRQALDPGIGKISPMKGTFFLQAVLRNGKGTGVMQPRRHFLPLLSYPEFRNRR